MENKFLPLDCFGVVVSFTRSEIVIKKLLLLSKMHKNYLEKEYSHFIDSEIGVKFRIRSKKKIILPKKPVLWVSKLELEGIEDNFPFRLFPNVRSLDVSFADIEPKFFCRIRCIQKLCLCDCKKITNKSLKPLNKTLKELKIEMSHRLGCLVNRREEGGKLPFDYLNYRVLNYIQNLEKLVFSAGNYRFDILFGLKDFETIPLSNIKKLKKLVFLNCRIYGSSLTNFKYVQSITFSHCKFESILLKDFKELEHLRKITLKDSPMNNLVIDNLKKDLIVRIK